MFQRILIANRGEIALRVIRACREMGIETVAIYSEADAQAIYLRHADETVCIGPAGSNRPYLDMPTIIAAAEIANVDAIHPGYGYLAENARFAEVCRECNLTFIGPLPETIALLGDKARARAMALQSGVPVVPGSEGLVADLDAALQVAGWLGYPVLLKASAGGGGRGMRIAHAENELRQAFQSAGSEALSAFRNGDLYVEKLVERPRHVEIQIMADTFGNVIHLGERDCSLQRRHQKLLEESPSPVLTPEMRQEMGDAAVRLARASGYVGAGTVEFLLTPDGNYYFIEVNARIQVEHPVTEQVTGIDVVKEQIRVAAGMPLSRRQEDIVIRGHAIECRINAEDPARGFAPSPGRLEMLVVPGGRGVRWDSHIYGGYVVPHTFDSLIAKLIVFGETREEALAVGRRALAEFVAEGIKTTVPLFRKIFEHTDFIRGVIDTGFIERYFSNFKG